MPAGDRRIFVVSPANYLDWETQNHVFDRMASTGSGRFNLTGQGEPDALRTAAVTGEFFNILGVQPLLAERWAPLIRHPTRRAPSCCAKALWRTRFGGDPAAIGRTIALNGEPYTIVGVVPQRTAFPENVDLWVPARVDARGARRPKQSHVLRHRPPASRRRRERRAGRDDDDIAQRLEAAVSRRTTRAGARSS